MWEGFEHKVKKLIAFETVNALFQNKKGFLWDDFLQNLVGMAECKSSHIQICMGSWLGLAILECICYEKNPLELKHMWAEQQPRRQLLFHIQLEKLILKILDIHKYSHNLKLSRHFCKLLARFCVDAVGCPNGIVPCWSSCAWQVCMWAVSRVSALTADSCLWQ